MKIVTGVAKLFTRGVKVKKIMFSLFLAIGMFYAGFASAQSELSDRIQDFLRNVEAYPGSPGLAPWARYSFELCLPHGHETKPTITGLYISETKDLPAGNFSTAERYLIVTNNSIIEISQCSNLRSKSFATVKSESAATIDVNAKAFRFPNLGRSSEKIDNQQTISLRSNVDGNVLECTGAISTFASQWDLDGVVPFEFQENIAGQRLIFNIRIPGQPYLYLNYLKLMD